MAGSPKRKIRWLLLCAALLLLVIYYSTGKVVKNYRACAGIMKIGNISYEDIVRRYGEPVSRKVESEDEWKDGLNQYTISTTHDHPLHGKMKFRYSNIAKEAFDEPEAWDLVTITTYNPKHYFGWCSIHVGSTREEVIKAYRRASPVKDVALGEQYFEGNWLNMNIVEFTYDENDIVTSIEFIEYMYLPFV